MSSAKFVQAVFVAAALLGSVGAQRARASGAEQNKTCVFEKYKPSHVMPYVSENLIDWGSYNFMGGAQLFVPAHEGLTKEWLAASVQQVFANAANATGVCKTLKVTDVNVHVVSAGTGFWVQLIGRNNETSAKVLDWARDLVAQFNKPAAPTVARAPR
jgi:hypothetical protein